MNSDKPRVRPLNLERTNVSGNDYLENVENYRTIKESVSSPAKSGCSAFSIDLDDYTNSSHTDELPAFDIRSISPMCRSPSPISLNDMCMDSTSFSLPSDLDVSLLSASQNNFDFMTLREINEQIKPLSDNEKSMQSPTDDVELETIFEGVFLETPPRKKTSKQLNMQKQISKKSAKSTINDRGKENQINNQDETEDLSIQCINRQNLYSLLKN